MTVQRFFIVLPLFVLTACSSVLQKQSAAQGAAIYATQKAIEAGRFDLAASYNAQATRLAIPPERTPQIRPFVAQGKRYVVLPPEFNGTPALVIGSSATDSLLAGEKPLASQLAQEAHDLEQTEKATDQVIAEKERIVDKTETAAVIQRHTIWGRIKLYGSLALVAAGIVALCIFFPAAIPVLLAIWRAIQAALSAIISFVGGLISKWTNKGGTH